MSDQIGKRDGFGIGEAGSVPASDPLATDPSIQRQGDRVVGTRRQKFFPQPSLD